ncbi:metalloregulator ArsR/SmtB family transcription factor [Luteococcus sp. H138]|uniref:helix-turn-helix transcriptional regulator n=1 Tax=unclassified Luteococcus TaxID=2639923 RepID=UPI00313D5DD4
MKSDEATVRPAQPGLVDADEDASTRERVARSILEHGASTAAELGERLNLTPAAIRRHLTVLTEQGHIEPREQRVYGARGRGRPAKVFALTDSGRSTFYQAYDELAIAALRQLVRAVGPSAISALAEQRVADVEAAFHRIRIEQPEATAAEVLAQALNTDGYVASVKPATLGEQLCQHHCPVAHVAEEFPQLCEAETALFSRLLGSHVQRLATIAHGDGICTTNIPLVPVESLTTHEPHDASNRSKGPLT